LRRGERPSLEAPTVARSILPLGGIGEIPTNEPVPPPSYPCGFPLVSRIIERFRFCPLSLLIFILKRTMTSLLPPGFSFRYYLLPGAPIRSCRKPFSTPFFLVWISTPLLVRIPAPPASPTSSPPPPSFPLSHHLFFQTGWRAGHS